MRYKALWLAAAAFSFALNAGAADFQIQRIDAGTLKFDGAIDKESADALFKALDERVTTLRVTSPGGDTGALRYPRDRGLSLSRLGNRTREHDAAEEFAQAPCRGRLPGS